MEPPEDVTSGVAVVVAVDTAHQGDAAVISKFVFEFWSLKIKISKFSKLNFYTG